MVTPAVSFRGTRTLPYLAYYGYYTEVNNTSDTHKCTYRNYFRTVLVSQISCSPGSYSALATRATCAWRRVVYFRTGPYNLRAWFSAFSTPSVPKPWLLHVGRDILPFRSQYISSSPHVTSFVLRTVHAVTADDGTEQSILSFLCSSSVTVVTLCEHGAASSSPLKARTSTSKHLTQRPTLQPPESPTKGFGPRAMSMARTRNTFKRRRGGFDST